jgi:hypothetical protein
MNHTAAPWQAKPIGTINGEPADWQITDGSGVIATIESHNQADARLIAAAPELLAALDMLIGAVEQHCMSDDPDVVEELNQARAAYQQAVEAV